MTEVTIYHLLSTGLTHLNVFASYCEATQVYSLDRHDLKVSRRRKCLGPNLDKVKKENIRTQYRSRGLAAGFSSVLGTLHMHIDGAENQELVIQLVQRLEQQGNLGKLNHVISFIRGPQRAALPDVYRSHTPGVGSKENFKFFSTHTLKNRADAGRMVNIVSEMFGATPGIVIEVEQPVMCLEPKGWKLLAESHHVAPIQVGEVKIQPSPSLDFEIHHRFDLPKTGPQVSLEELGRYCEGNGITFGGWFIFEKPSAWAYRSNSFSSQAGLRELVEREQTSLNLFLKQQNVKCNLRTVVERVLGIWNRQKVSREANAGLS